MKMMLVFWFGFLFGAWTEWRCWYRRGVVPKHDGTYYRSKT